jgi:hypothetical protein
LLTPVEEVAIPVNWDEGEDAGLAGRAEETVGAHQQQLADLESAFKAEAEAAASPLAETIETVTVRPAKQNISVKLVALAWAPWWRTESGERTPAWK